ncbi:MAG: hypothetical protein LLG04_17875, partial [Parachlamydia sp.]|nr:hypothetical protein [Parachlamydia sp.]
MSVNPSSAVIHTWVFPNHEVRLHESEVIDLAVQKQRGTKRRLRSSKNSEEKDSFEVVKKYHLERISKGARALMACNPVNTKEALLISDPAQAPASYSDLNPTTFFHPLLDKPVDTHQGIQFSLLKRIEKVVQKNVEGIEEINSVVHAIWWIENPSSKKRAWHYCNGEEMRHLAAGLKACAVKEIINYIKPSLEFHLQFILHHICKHDLKRKIENRIIFKPGFDFYANPDLSTRSFADKEILVKALAGSVPLAVQSATKYFELSEEEAKFAVDELQQRTCVEALDFELKEKSPSMPDTGLQRQKRVKEWDASTSHILCEYLLKHTEKILIEIIKKRMAKRIDQLEIADTFCDENDISPSDLTSIGNNLTEILKQALKLPIYSAEKTSIPGGSFRNVPANILIAFTNWANHPSSSDISILDASKFEINGAQLYQYIRDEQKAHLSHFRVCFPESPALLSKIQLQVISRLGQVVLNRENWAVSLLVSHRSSADCSIVSGGHAKICIEGITE